MDLEQILTLLMQLLQSPPDEPAGDVPDGLPTTAAPGGAKVMDERQQLMSGLMQLVSSLQQAGSPQQSMNASRGVSGGPYGALGGRPRGG